MIKKVYIFLVILGTSLCCSIIDLEPLPSLKNIKKHHSISISNTFLIGNNNYFKIKPSYQLIYPFKRNQKENIILNSSLEYAKSEQIIVTNQSFFALRYLYNYTSQNSLESFIQLSSNEFINLRERFLIGTVRRHRLPTTTNNEWTFLYGAMLEYENISNDDNTLVVRGTFTAIYNLNLNDIGNIYFISYIQPQLTKIQDIRSYNSIIFKHPITKNTSIELKAFIEYDSYPTTDVLELDSSFYQTLSIQF